MVIGAEGARTRLCSFKSVDQCADEPFWHDDRRRQLASQQHAAFSRPHVHPRASGRLPRAKLRAGTRTLAAGLTSLLSKECHPEPQAKDLRWRLESPSALIGSYEICI